MTETARGEPAAKPSRLFPLFVGLGFGLILLLATIAFLPVEWSEAKLRFKLWRAGARPVLWEKHRGFTQDRCGGHSPAECECVWFIHGMGDSVVTWRNVFLDPGAFEGMPLRIFAIDLPGHGGSIRRHDLTEYRASNVAREIDAEIAKVSECTRNAIVGNSFGGWIAARMALESPKRYARLVLIGPGGLRSSEAATKDLFKDATVESLKEFQRRAYFKPRILSDREWEAAAGRMKGGAVDEIRGAQIDADRLDGSLAKITTPTTLVWGEGDRIVTRAVIDDYAKGLPSREVVTISECGHLPQKECPGKLFPILRRALAN